MRGFLDASNALFGFAPNLHAPHLARDTSLTPSRTLPGSYPTSIDAVELRMYPTIGFNDTETLRTVQTEECLASTAPGHMPVIEVRMASTAASPEPPPSSADARPSASNVVILGNCGDANVGRPISGDYNYGLPMAALNTHNGPSGEWAVARPIPAFGLPQVPGGDLTAVRYNPGNSSTKMATCGCDCAGRSKCDALDSRAGDFSSGSISSFDSDPHGFAKAPGSGTTEEIGRGDRSDLHCGTMDSGTTEEIGRGDRSDLHCGTIRSGTGTMVSGTTEEIGRGDRSDETRFTSVRVDTASASSALPTPGTASAPNISAILDSIAMEVTARESSSQESDRDNNDDLRWFLRDPARCNSCDDDSGYDGDDGDDDDDDYNGIDERRGNSDPYDSMGWYQALRAIAHASLVESQEPRPDPLESDSSEDLEITWEIVAPPSPRTPVTTTPTPPTIRTTSRPPISATGMAARESRDEQSDGSGVAYDDDDDDDDGGHRTSAAADPSKTTTAEGSGRSQAAQQLPPIPTITTSAAAASLEPVSSGREVTDLPVTDPDNLEELPQQHSLPGPGPGPEPRPVCDSLGPDPSPPQGGAVREVPVTAAAAVSPVGTAGAAAPGPIPWAWGGEGAEATRAGGL
ncbi:hypothetical protein F4780DRAFT_794193 [Xylariomycetidae sp. FL0641]|nr:hypothetical protein F4780DRAFT_794193 [Xylariomycetidae sp. FL0641]